MGRVANKVEISPDRHHFSIEGPRGFGAIVTSDSRTMSNMFLLLGITLLVVGSAALFWRTDCVVTQLHFPDNLPLAWLSLSIRIASWLVAVGGIVSGSLFIAFNGFELSGRWAFGTAVACMTLTYFWVSCLAAGRALHRLRQRGLV